MGVVTLLKKFKTLIYSLFCLVSLGEFNLEAATRMPLLHTVGVIPNQWQGEIANLEFKKNVDSSFSLAVRHSARFRVLNDELVKNLWSSPAGRSELVEDYELNAFASLAIAQMGDSLVFSSRLLSPELELYLEETMTVDRDEYLAKSYDEISDFLTDLVFKTLNRLPIDISVTSVQGAYITVSGGMKKGLTIGSKLEIIRPEISSVNPATKSWTSFTAGKQGEAEVIEVKDNTAVAKLTKLNYENAVVVGDGAKVGSIAGRVHYKASSSSNSTRKVQDSKTIIVAPLYTGKRTKPKRVEIRNSPVMQEKIAPKNIEDQPAKLEKKVAIGASEPSSTGGGFSFPELGDLNLNLGINDKVGTVMSHLADKVVVQVGQRTWTYTGPGGTTSQFTWYLPVNVVSARITRLIMSSIKYDLGGGISYGYTENDNSFFFYDSHARLYWEQEMPLLGGFIQRVKAGVEAHFTGVGVSGETYGGSDVISGGMFGALEGVLRPEDVGADIDWYGEFSITPLTIGRTGYEGGQKTIRSSFGWHLALGGFLTGARNTLEWGGEFNYSGINLFDSSGQETGVSTYTFLAQSRYRF